jgi:hypothetical protein
MECSSPFNLSLYIIKPPVVTNVSHLGHDLSLVQIVSLFLSKYIFFSQKITWTDMDNCVVVLLLYVFTSSFFSTYIYVFCSLHVMIATCHYVLTWMM